MQQTITKIVALAFMISGAVASDVYATFHSDEGTITPNFDVSNTGCFSISDATFATFNQHANGPYCLHAWTTGGCPNNPDGSQTFQGLNTGTDYSLNADIAYAAQNQWTLGAC